MHQPLPPHLMVGAGGAPVMGMGAHQQQSGVPNGHAQFAPPAPDNNTTTFVTNSGTISSNSSSKALYGSGDADDGYSAFVLLARRVLSWIVVQIWLGVPKSRCFLPMES